MTGNDLLMDPIANLIAGGVWRDLCEAAFDFAMQKTKLRQQKNLS